MLLVIGYRCFLWSIFDGKRLKVLLMNTDTILRWTYVLLFLERLVEYVEVWYSGPGCDFLDGHVRVRHEE